MVGDVPGLTKYRIDGRHSDVARAALPTTLGIIRRFLGKGVDLEARLEDIATFPSGNALGVQVRIDDAKGPTGAANWFLEGKIGRTRFRQILSDHDLPFVKYTNEAQQLRSELDDFEGIFGLVAYDADGRKWSAPLPDDTDIHLDHPPRMRLPIDRLSLGADEPTPYAIVRDETVARFSYVCQTGVGSDDVIDVHIVDDIASFDLAEARHRSNARFVAAVETSTGEELLDLMIQRMHVASTCATANVRTGEAPRSPLSELETEIDASSVDSSQPTFS